MRSRPIRSNVCAVSAGPGETAAQCGIHLPPIVRREDTFMLDGIDRPGPGRPRPRRIPVEDLSVYEGCGGHTLRRHVDTKPGDEMRRILREGVAAAGRFVSRATAQRYRARLEAAGRITMTLRYGSAGRPEHRYRYQRSDFPGASGLPFPL